MRHGLTWTLLFGMACASASPPPGGPEDKVAPKLLRSTPDTNALNAKVDRVSFHFDEVINDRGSGEQTIDRYFLLSPSDGAPRISWHRSRIDVRPRRGFRENTAYVVTVLPGLSDLRGNVMKGSATVVFSTGPAIPTGRIIGTVFDWAAERPAPNAYLEAMTPDSVTYLAQSDSTGRFILGPLPEGTYLVRALLDQNSNRARDRGEFFDSLRIAVPQLLPAELLAAARDTLYARVTAVEVKDSVTLSVTFDRAVDPALAVAPSQFRLAAADSVEVPILQASTPREQKRADSVASVTRADSARRADSLAGRPVQAVNPPAAPQRPAVNEPAPLPKPSLPPPFSIITLRIGAPLRPNTGYRLTVTGIRSLGARSQPSAYSFTTPRPAPQPATRDTTPRAPAAPGRP